VRCPNHQPVSPSVRVRIPAVPRPRWQCLPTLPCPWLALHAVLVPPRRCRSRPPQRCRSTDPVPGVPAPRAADAASPTRSDTNRSPATAEDSTRTIRPSGTRTSSRPQTTPSVASYGGRTTSPRSPRSGPHTTRTCTRHRRPPTRRRSRIADTRTRAASAANPSSPSSQHQFRTKTETPPPTSDSPRQPSGAATSLPKATPLR